MKILAQTYPNNEIRFRFILSPPDKERACDRDRALTLTANSGTKESSRARGVRVDGRWYRPGYGMQPRKTKFGLRACRTILRVGGVMDGLSGWNTCITLTLPASTVESYQTLSDYSSYCVDRFKSWLKDQVRDRENFRYFYVWELQKRGALHLHLCVNSPSRAVLQRLREGSKSAWIRTLLRVEELSGCNMFAGRNNRDWRYHPEKIQVDVQVVRTSVAAYFAKYCSKDKRMRGSGVRVESRPVRWWGCSRLLLGEMRAASTIQSTPHMHPGQCMSVFSRLVGEVCQRTEKTHIFEERYSRMSQFVGYVGSSVLGEVREKIDEIFDELRCCKLDKKKSDKEYKKAKKFFDKMWKKNDSRIDLYQALIRERDTWDILVLWRTDERAVEPDLIVKIRDRYMELIRQDNPPNDEPIQQSFLGDDWW